MTLRGERQAGQSIIAANILCCSSWNNPAGIHCDLHLCAGFPLKLMLLLLLQLHTRTDNINTTPPQQHNTGLTVSTLSVFPSALSPRSQKESGGGVKPSLTPPRSHISPRMHVQHFAFAGVHASCTI